jgi:hypothetical protein
MAAGANARDGSGKKETTVNGTRKLAIDLGCIVRA